MRRVLLPLLVTVVALSPSSADSAASAESPKTRRVSVSSAGGQGSRDSEWARISADGRFVAFASQASNLVATDRNGVADVFVRDRNSGRTSRVSVSSRGVEANGESFAPDVSADGRFVSFGSYASNLVPRDTNHEADVFVHDRTTGRTTRVSVSSDEEQANAPSFEQDISPDGGFIAFASAASNLTREDDTNGEEDIFVRELSTGTTVRVSVGPGGEQANDPCYSPVISSGGRFVAFQSIASNLNAKGDTNESSDVFVRDRSAGVTSRVSVTFKGGQANWDSFDPAISPDGRFVAFSSFASNLNAGGDTNEVTDVFVRDRSERTTMRVSVTWRGRQGDWQSYDPAISPNARFVSFTSLARNLNRTGDTNKVHDVFVRDRVAGTTVRASVGAGGRQGNGLSSGGDVTSSGRFVSFLSFASNLAEGDTNEAEDVFVRDRGDE